MFEFAGSRGLRAVAASAAVCVPDSEFPGALTRGAAGSSRTAGSGAGIAIASAFTIPAPTFLVPARLSLIVFLYCEQRLVNCIGKSCILYIYESK